MQYINIEMHRIVQFSPLGPTVSEWSLLYTRVPWLVVKYGVLSLLVGRLWVAPACTNPNTNELFYIGLHLNLGHAA